MPALSKWYAMRTLGIDGRDLHRNSKTPFAESARDNPLSLRVFLSDAHISVTTEHTITYDHLDRAGCAMSTMPRDRSDENGGVRPTPWEDCYEWSGVFVRGAGGGDLTCAG